MAKRRAISSPEAPDSRTATAFKMMTDPGGRPDGRQERKPAIVDLPTLVDPPDFVDVRALGDLPALKRPAPQRVCLVGDQQEYFPRPYYRSGPLFAHDLADHNLWEWDEFMDKFPCETDPRVADFPRGHEVAMHQPLSMPQVRPTRHTLVEVRTQTRVEQDRSTRVVSTICIRCLHHVVLRVNSSIAGNSLCWHLDIDMFHELELSSRPPRDHLEQQRTRWWPLANQATYQCVDPDCDLTAEVTVLEPFLPYEYIRLLLDEKRVQRRLKQVMIETPARLENVDTTEWASGAILNLWRYLDHLLTGNESNGRTTAAKGEPRAFSKRVKRFDVVLGPEFYQLFRDMGYTEEHLNDEDHFRQTLPEMYEDGYTPVKSYRGFIEGCAAELKIFEARRRMAFSAVPDRNQDELFVKEQGFHPARDSFLKALNCFQYPRRNTNGDLSYHHRFIGTLPDMVGSALVACANRRGRYQPRLDDSFRDSLHAIARDMTGHVGQQPEFLKGVTRNIPIDGGNDYYPAWGLNPIINRDEQRRRTEDEVYNGLLAELRKIDRTTRDGQKEVAGKFELFHSYVRLRPEDGDCARLRFRVLGWSDREDLDKPGPPMLLEVAATVLALDLASDSDTELWSKIKRQIQVTEDKKLLVCAMEAIDAHRGALHLEEGSVRIKEAAQSVAASANAMADAIGLRNIGNTCYLNSILQYLYTLVPIRTLIENLDQYKLDPNDIANRKISGTTEAVKPIELETALYFVGDALPSLFRDLQTASRGPCAPSQGLANAVLLSMTDLEKLGQDTTPSSQAAPEQKTTDSNDDTKQASQNAPPLPARPNATATVAEGSSDATARPPADSGLPSPMSSTATLTGDAASDNSFNLPGKDGAAAGEGTPATHTLSSESTLSSAASVNAGPDADGDVQMDGAGATDTTVTTTPVEKEFNWESFREALPKKHDFPMTQQDVDEILGKVFGLLQAAIRPSDIDTEAEKDGVQVDNIVNNFYFKINRVMQTLDESNNVKESTSMTSVHRALTAYPNPDQPLTIYEALDKWGFDPETIETSGNNEKQRQYCSFKEPTPPFLHVLIQRNLGPNQRNKGIVQIAEYLDMDRYMESPGQPEHFSRRQMYWETKELQAKLLKIKSKLESRDVMADIRPMGPLTIPDELQGDHLYREKAITLLQKLTPSGTRDDAMSLIGQLFHETSSSSPVSSSASLNLDAETEKLDVQKQAAEQLAAEVDGTMQLDGSESGAIATSTAADTINEETQVNLHRTLLAKIDRCIASTSHLRDSLFDHMARHRYALHAVICHSGTGAGGHYWVWIRDFSTGAWRKYNDEQTTEMITDTSALLRELNSQDYPYFVAYVRDADKEKLVGSPPRKPREEPGQDGMEMEDKGKSKAVAEAPMEIVSSHGN